LALLASCYSPKKAERQLARAIKYPKVTSGFCVNLYPIKTKTDTLFLTEYDWIELDCPGQMIKYDTITKKADTIFISKKVKVQQASKKITITKTIIDSASNTYYKSLNLELQSKLTKVESKLHKKGNWINILLFALGLLILLLLLIKRK
jgi:hypothetical protein